VFIQGVRERIALMLREVSMLGKMENQTRLGGNNVSNAAINAAMYRKLWRIPIERSWRSGRISQLLVPV